MIFNKKAQEEMVGFAIIIVVVSVILLIFLGFSLNKPEKQTVESYEVESFIESLLQYSTDCSNYREDSPSIKRLIMECYNQNMCTDGRSACEALNSILSNIIEEVWKVGETRPVKGYELNINSNDEDFVSIVEGNVTKNYKTSTQNFIKSGQSINIFFTAYY